MLFIGEKVGMGQRPPNNDIALDPLEGTTITAKAGRMRSRCWLRRKKAACSNKRNPTYYMDKLAVGPGYPEASSTSPGPRPRNVMAVAEAKGVKPADINVWRARPAAPRPELIAETARARLRGWC